MLVAGVDSSTQSSKAMLCRVDDGSVVEQAPPRTRTAPSATRGWVDALAGRRRAAEPGRRRRGGGSSTAWWRWTTRRRCARRCSGTTCGRLPRRRSWWPSWAARKRGRSAAGSVLDASFTVTKLRWLADHEPEHAAPSARCCCRTTSSPGSCDRRADAPATDRGDASGTGYFSTRDGAWRPDLAGAALGHRAGLAAGRRAGRAGRTDRPGAGVAPGTGDNMAAALGLGLREGDVAVSIGTSGIA